MDLLALSTIILLIVVTAVSFSDELKNWLKMNHGRKRTHHNRYYHFSQPHNHKTANRETG